jgi:hypothetical protein
VAISVSALFGLECPECPFGLFGLCGLFAPFGPFGLLRRLFRDALLELALHARRVLAPVQP